MNKIQKIITQIQSMIKRKTTFQLFNICSIFTVLFFTGFGITIINTSNSFFQGLFFFLTSLALGTAGLVMVIRREFPYSPASDNIFGVIIGVVLLIIEILGIFMAISIFWLS